MRQLHWHLNFDEWQYVINVSDAECSHPVTAECSYPVTCHLNSINLCGTLRAAVVGCMPSLLACPPGKQCACVLLLLPQGTLEVGVFLAPGNSATGVIGPGDLGFAPQGSGHYLRNLGKEAAHVVLIFNSGTFTNVDLNNFLGTFPPSWVAASLDISTAEAQEVDYDLPGFAPALKPPAGRQQHQGRSREPHAGRQQPNALQQQ
jgi:hypothetical protein